MKQIDRFTSPPGTISVRISPETTFLAEPLTESGRVDYVLAIEQQFAPAGPVTENGYRDLIQGLGKTVLDLDSSSSEENQPADRPRWNYLCRKLDVDPDLKPPLRYTPLSEHVLEKPRSGPWTLGEHPAVEQWIDDNETLYRLFETAIGKPHFYTLYVESGDQGSVSSLLPGMWFDREIARCFTLRSNARLSRNEHDAAWVDTLAIFTLARHIQNQPLMISSLLGFALEGAANAQAVRVLKHSRFDVPKLRQCLADLQSHRPPMSYEDVLLSERLYCLGTLCEMSRHGYGSSSFNDGVLPPEFFEEERDVAQLIRAVGIDWNVVLRRTNEAFDRILMERSMDSTGIDPFAVPKSDLRLTPSEYLKMDLNTRSEKIAQRLLSQCGSNIEVFLPVSERNRTTTDLTRLAFLLEIRRQEKGDYPKHLETLWDEQYLSEPPIDCMNRTVPSSYKYRREGSGYLLYSVGMSGRDDGGNGEGFIDESTWQDDIVVRMD